MVLGSFALLASLAARDTLHGTVADTAGRPLAAATVSVAELGLTAVTQTDGAFRFADLPSGRYTVVVRMLGYAPTVASATVAGPPLRLVLRPTILHLEAVTVTATRSAIAPLTSPLPTAELADERMRRFHEVSLAHALDQLPGVRTLSTGEQVGKPVIRGLTGPRVLVLDNGQRLEDYSWSDEDGPSADARLAERVEVVRGPASVLYGSDAIGGVINVIPTEVPDGRGRAAFARGALELYGATNNSELGTVLRAQGANGRFGWNVKGIGRRADNFHTPTGNDSTPTGDIYNTAFHAINGEAAVGWHGDRTAVTLRYTRYGGAFGLLDGPPVPADNTNGPLRRLSDNRLQLATNSVIGSLRLETKSQWQRHSLQEVSDQSRNGDSTPNFDLLLNTYSTDVLLHHASSDRLTGTVGVSAVYQDNQTRGVEPLVPAARTVGGAVFALETASLARWTLMVGARGDLRHLSADSNAALGMSAQTRDAAAFTANVGLAYRAAPGLALGANVGRAFRAPTLFELFTNGPHLGEDRYEIGLPSARPEVSFNTDVSVRWRGSRVRGELAAYRNQIDSYLYIAPTGTTDPGSGLAVYRYRQARAVLLGAEAGAEVAATNTLALRARLDAVRGTNGETHEPLPLTPAPRADLEAEWHATGLRWAERLYLSAGLQAVTRQTRLGPFDEQTPAYQLLNFGAGLEQTVGGRLVSLDVRVRNATNTRYTDFLSRYKLFAYGEGRNVVVRLSIGE
ncbi:MAG TPA: TonB-dependent receptor [Gemmatimonadales bacterium]|nr:TonB-dependent receptor [Gemmatimonadales bacterium]